LARVAARRAEGDWESFLFGKIFTEDFADYTVGQASLSYPCDPWLKLFGCGLPRCEVS
jgi:hypothetical protein